MDKARAVATPCPTNSDPPSLHRGALFHDPTPYRSKVGALQYVTITRPDLVYDVTIACQFMHVPTETHWPYVKRILRFISSTLSHGILFTKGSQGFLHAFSDAGCAGDHDTRRSVGGYAIFLGSNLISWSSRKQRTVARSSIEAEFKCLADTTTEIIWIQALLSDLRITFQKSPVLWCDNISAIYLSDNPVFHARTKYMEIDYHLFVSELISANYMFNISLRRTNRRTCSPKPFHGLGSASFRTSLL
ncbi:secreted RxLR effector protein 161-like [Rhodamnia argentea]|uniref:Secreted RxLR effector protein 161-like n=1 Tax=Rhodamnia argentea TaxID=178133 RepID=A0ABM3HPP1_9MYRT|nr:secreted RxLR effector protein 161-like [Rhodamnia argentea]